MIPSVSVEYLSKGKCVPCEGGIARLSLDEATLHLPALPGWEVLSDPDRIRKCWTVKNFVSGMEFFRQVMEIAEQEGHHPDLHLVNYRKVSIEIWTHAISGLSLNDFILAAMIDQLPVCLGND